LIALVERTDTDSDRFQATLHGYQLPDEDGAPAAGQDGVSPDAIPEPPPTPTRAWIRGEQLAKERKEREAMAAAERRHRRGDR
jgi:hypothetical protein